MKQISALQILQDARGQVYFDMNHNADAWWILTAAISHLIGASRVSSVERLDGTGAELKFILTSIERAEAKDS